MGIGAKRMLSFKSTPNTGFAGSRRVGSKWAGHSPSTSSPSNISPIGKGGSGMSCRGIGASSSCGVSERRSIKSSPVETLPKRGRRRLKMLPGRRGDEFVMCRRPSPLLVPDAELLLCVVDVDGRPVEMDGYL